MVQALSDCGDADSERARVLVREVVRDLHLHVSLRDAVFAKRAILLLYRVDAVREAADAVAGLEGLGDLGAHLDDSAHVIAADGAAFALLG